MLKKEEEEETEGTHRRIRNNKLCLKEEEEEGGIISHIYLIDLFCCCCEGCLLERLDESQQLLELIENVYNSSLVTPYMNMLILIMFKRFPSL